MDPDLAGSNYMRAISTGALQANTAHDTRAVLGLVYYPFNGASYLPAPFPKIRGLLTVYQPDNRSKYPNDLAQLFRYYLFQLYCYLAEHWP